jgi:hypothetical protein
MALPISFRAFPASTYAEEFTSTLTNPTKISGPGATATRGWGVVEEVCRRPRIHVREQGARIIVPIEEEGNAEGTPVAVDQAVRVAGGGMDAGYPAGGKLRDEPAIRGPRASA